MLTNKNRGYRGLHYFLIFALNIDCGYSLGGSNLYMYTRSMFRVKIRKLYKKKQFLAFTSLRIAGYFTDMFSYKCVIDAL